jgi:pimeloyl-ACP methyl ester carboxylesterase
MPPIAATEQNMTSYLAATTKTTPDPWLAQGHRERVPSGDSVFVVDTGHRNLPPVLLLHGFPTWSLDWEGVAQHLAGHARVIAPDFLGFGYSDKPRRTYAIAAQADIVEALLAARHLTTVAVAANDYGVLVVQELLRRRAAGSSRVTFSSLTLLNAGIMYDQYRPTRVQRLLATPVIGPLVARLIGRNAMHRSLAEVSGRPRPPAEFDRVWTGIAREDGPLLLPRLLRFNAERAQYHAVWEQALAEASTTIPLALVWGLQDPVSGPLVLAAARVRYPRAVVTELPAVGHYPPVEVPDVVAHALLANARRGWSRP